MSIIGFLFKLFLLYLLVRLALYTMHILALWRKIKDTAADTNSRKAKRDAIDVEFKEVK